MTPQEKADELFAKFGYLAPDVVEEIMKQKPQEPISYNSTIGYWIEVLTFLKNK
jgi:hypothetical protein